MPDPTNANANAQAPADMLPATTPSAVTTRVMPPMTPLRWAQARGVKWSTACLAAAMCGWDRTQDDGLAVSGDVWDAAVLAAEAKVEECRKAAGKLPDSTATRRVFVLAHPGEMHAVVAYKPGVAETLAIMEQMNDDATPLGMRIQQAMEALWQRVLWPTGAERTAYMDDSPGGYANLYPTAYMRAIGLRTEDVRGK